MDYPIYEIFIKDHNILFIFCSEEKYNKSLEKTINVIFTNMYIYEDDTLIEVINKIKLNIIKHISDYNQIKFENLSGFLSTNWNYYNSLKLQEYVRLYILDENKECLVTDFVEKLSIINRQYTSELTRDKIILENIDFSNISLLNNNELVIGYYDLDLFNNFKYYINPKKMLQLIELNKLIHNELNKPINSYINYIIEDTSNNINIQQKENITQFNFEINTNETFVFTNYISLPQHLESDINNYNFLNNLYENDNKNKLNINLTNSDKIENFSSKIIDNINILSLKIVNYSKIDLQEIYKNTKLDKNCPFSMLSVISSKKPKRTYKVFKLNKVPYIKQDILENIIYTKEGKIKNKAKNINTDYVLFKIYYKKNEIITNYLIDVYLIDDNYFYISFNFIDNNIKNVGLNDIILNINNILNTLQLTIGNKKQINNIDEFYFYNNNNTIIINNDNNYISSDFKLVLNYNELNIPAPKNVIHKFIHFIILFNNFFDIYIDKLEVLYNSKIYIVDYIDDKIIKCKGLKELSIDKCTDITIRTTKIKLYYKKSYNYDSYNYLEKFFKYVVTFDEGTLQINFNCNFSNKTKKTILDEFLKYNNYRKYESIYTNDNLEKINKMLEMTNYLDEKYCNPILKNTNQKTNIDIEIDFNIFYINVINSHSFVELENICNMFHNFIYFTDNYNMKSENRLLLHNNIYYLDNNNVFNMYNNIYNIHNTLSKNNINEYYIYKLFESLYDTIEVAEKKISYSAVLYSDSDSDSDSDSEEDDDDREEETEQVEKKEKFSDIVINDEVDTFTNENQYKKKFYNGDKYKKLKDIFGSNYTKSFCENPRRPSVIHVDDLEKIIEKELANKIIINKTPKQVFYNLFNLDSNILQFNINNNNLSFKNPLKLHMGREYTFNINYTNTLDKYKLVLLFNVNNNFVSDDKNFNKDTIINTDYMNIKDTNNRLEIFSEKGTKLDVDDYLAKNDTSFTFKLNFPHNRYNELYKHNYRIVLYDISENKIATDSIIKIELERPKNYYYDKYDFGDYYFVYLPGATASSQKTDIHPLNIDNMICCYKDAPHINKDLSNNNKKIPYENKNRKVIDSEETFKLQEYFRLSRIPQDIYNNICTFMSLDTNNDYFNLEKEIIPIQPYRFGLENNNNIHSLLNSIFYIIKFSELKEFKVKFNNIFNFDIIVPNQIKDGLIKCIKNPKIMNKSKLLKLNNNIYAKNKKLKQLQKLIINPIAQKQDIFSSNSYYEEIRDAMADYINKSFVNLDINFIWNLCSIIFNINIILFELEFSNKLTNSVKCPLVNNHNIYDFNNRNTCFILKFDNTYQPITIPTVSSSNSYKYNILFNLKNKDSITNLNNLFSKCLLKYNDEKYNDLLINSVYHGIDYTDNIIIETEDIIKLSESIKYIVINADYIKLGFIFSVNKNYLFIPINYIKHNINYEIIEKDYKYIYKTESDTGDNFIHDFTTTKKIIQEFTTIHQNNKLSLNNKYITKGEFIIGIGLYIGDYIPIIPIKITDVPDSEWDSIILSDISYINDTIYSEEDKIEIYNKFDYINLYYDQFLNSVTSILQIHKINIEEIINTTDKSSTDKIQELTNYIERIFDTNDLFSFKEFMYLHNKKPTHDIVQNFKLCNTLNVDDECENNCTIDESKCKYIITEEYYNIFIKFLVNDLLYNNYKKYTILNKKSISDEYIHPIDADDFIIFNNTNDIDKSIINNLYNNIFTEKQYYNIGYEYNNIKNTITNTKNDVYCTNEVFLEDLNITYFDFKSIKEINTIAYSNCIYYNLSKLYVPKINENISYIDNIRNNIADSIRKSINSKNFNLFDIINYYISKNNNHLYTNINNTNELYNVLITDKHWCTELDLFIFSELYQKKILFYKLHHSSDNLEYGKGCYMIIGEEYSEIVKIFVKPFYYKNLYYLIKN